MLLVQLLLQLSLRKGILIESASTEYTSLDFLAAYIVVVPIHAPMSIQIRSGDKNESNISK